MARSLYFAPMILAGLVAAPAAAEQHEVLVLGTGFFPGVIYANTGDTIRFVNESEATQYLIGDDNIWTIGPISPGAEVTFTIPHGMTHYFSSADTIATFDDTNLEGARNRPPAQGNSRRPPPGREGPAATAGPDYAGRSACGTRPREAKLTP